MENQPDNNNTPSVNEVANGAAKFLCQFASEVNSTKTTIKIEELVNSEGRELGDWIVTVEKIKKQ